MHHRFAGYGPVEGEIPARANGVLVSNVSGKCVAYALDGLQQRAELFVVPNDEIYEGMIVGENSRDNDLAVNPTREKKLTNIRAAGADENVILKPAREEMRREALPGTAAACRVVPAGLGHRLGDVAALCAAIAASGGPTGRSSLASG